MCSCSISHALMRHKQRKIPPFLHAAPPLLTSCCSACVPACCSCMPSCCSACVANAGIPSTHQHGSSPQLSAPLRSALPHDDSSAQQRQGHGLGQGAARQQQLQQQQQQQQQPISGHLLGSAPQFCMPSSFYHSAVALGPGYDTSG